MSDEVDAERSVRRADDDLRDLEIGRVVAVLEKAMTEHVQQLRELTRSTLVFAAQLDEIVAQLKRATR